MGDEFATPNIYLYPHTPYVHHTPPCVSW